jgi:hypothetical protein
MLTRSTAMPGLPKMDWRTLTAALAFAALALLLLRPICEIAFGEAHAGQGRAALAGELHLAPGGHDGPEGVCCASVKDGTYLKAQPISLAAGGGALGAALLPLAGFPHRRVRRSRATILLADSPEPSYYARSARIQR